MEELPGSPSDGANDGLATLYGESLPLEYKQPKKNDYGDMVMIF